MSARLIWILSLSSLLMAGCHYRDPSIDLLEGELRWMEDQLYIMEGELEQACADLAQCQGSVTADSGWERVEPTPAVLPRSETIAPPRDSTGSDTFEAPTVELPNSSDSAPAEPPGRLDRRFEIPRVELPEAEPMPLDPNPEIPELRQQLDGPETETRPAQPAQDMFSIRLQSLAAAEPAPARGPDKEGIDAHITHIVVTPWQGEKWAAKPSASDLLVVVEPRNADGEYVALPGAVSVVVLDAQQAGAAARVARWDFDASQTVRLIRRSDSARGIHLQLEWPAEAPDSPDLHLYVRYVTVDGRKLQTDRRLASSVETTANQAESKASQWSIVEDPPSQSRWTVVDHSETEPAISEAEDTVPPEPNKLPILAPRPDVETGPGRDAFARDSGPPGTVPAGGPGTPELRPRHATRPTWKPYR